MPNTNKQSTNQVHLPSNWKCIFMPCQISIESQKKKKKVSSCQPCDIKQHVECNITADWSQSTSFYQMTDIRKQSLTHLILKSNCVLCIFQFHIAACFIQRGDNTFIIITNSFIQRYLSHSDRVEMSEKVFEESPYP